MFDNILGPEGEPKLSPISEFSPTKGGWKKRRGMGEASRIFFSFYKSYSKLFGCRPINKIFTEASMCVRNRLTGRQFHGWEEGGRVYSTLKQRNKSVSSNEKGVFFKSRERARERCSKLHRIFHRL